MRMDDYLIIAYLISRMYGKVRGNGDVRVFSIDLVIKFINNRKNG